MEVTRRAYHIDWDQLRCCQDCLVGYVYYALLHKWLYRVTPTRLFQARPAVPPARNSPLRDYDHILIAHHSIPSSLDVSEIESFEDAHSLDAIHDHRRRLPEGYIEVNGRPCLRLSREYIAYIGHPRHVLWFPPHVTLEGDEFAIRLPEWCRAPCGPFLTVGEVFELARRKGRVRTRRRFRMLLIGLPVLAMLCFIIFFVGCYLA